MGWLFLLFDRPDEVVGHALRQCRFEATNPIPERFGLMRILPPFVEFEE